MPETQMNLEKAPVVEGSAAGNRQFAGTAEAGAEDMQPAGRATRMLAAEVAAAGRETVPVVVSRGAGSGDAVVCMNKGTCVHMHVEAQRPFTGIFFGLSLLSVSH